jgi:glucose/arabinose dehydrogenase
VLSTVVTAAAGLVVLGGLPQASGAPSMPAGFVLRDTPTGQGPYNLTDFAYLPDGSLLTAGKNGRVTWVPQGGAPKTIAQLATDTTGDLGLVGLGVPADFAETGHIFLVRSIPVSPPGWVLRLSRFTVQGAAAPSGLTDEQVLLQFPAAASIHGMTGLVPAPDGTLWVSIGDLQFASKVFPDALKTFNLDEPAGKLLHITADGAGVPSNPFYDAAHPTSWRSRVYASGFRSPFRFALNPATGTPVLGDVGWTTWEEIDVVSPGRNYKWPCWEGPRATPGYIDLPGCAEVANTPPLWSYRHGSASGQGNSVVAGLVYTGTTYPAAYRGAFFFGDFTARKLWTLRFDEAGRLVKPPEDPPFGSDIGAPVEFAAAPNGDVAFADLATGSVRRLSYSPGNTQPMAKATTTTDPDTRTVTFDASESVDFDGDPLIARWVFGDGTTGTGLRTSHVYSASGDTFTARLTVTDPLGASDTVAITVAPSNHSPVLTLVTPGNTTFAVGTTVTVSGTAVDAEDGALPVRWTSAVLHCAEASTCHLHPGLESTGSTFSTAFPDHTDSRLLVTATVQDSAGVEASRTYEALPRQHRLTLLSNVPAVLQIPGVSSSNTALVTEGADVEVVAAATANDGYGSFVGWSDGAASRTRVVAMGTRDITLTATYATPIGARYAAEPRLRALLGAAVGPETAAGAVRYQVFQRGRLYWSAARGVHEVHGAILGKFLRLGGHTALGVPVTDEIRAADGQGAHSNFERAAVYWSTRTGARVVRGALLQRYRSLGAGASVLGYPVIDDRRSRTRGRFVDFERAGSIYWSARTGAHEVYGPIRRRWSALGRETSWLGLPTSGVRKVAGGQRSDFQHGFIRWFSATGRTVVRRS